MKNYRFLRLAAWVSAVLSLQVFAGNLEVISVVNPAAPPAAGGNADSWSPVLSADGRYVLFASLANNLLTWSNAPLPLSSPPKVNVFLRDRTNGTTRLISVDAAGTGGGNGGSFPAALSADGNLAVIESTATNLIAGGTNKFSAIFLRDLTLGSTTLVSAGTNSFANGESYGATMTPDGRYVAFVSAANNLVPGDTNGIADIFVRDVLGGSNNLVSVGARSPIPVSGATTPAFSDGPDISADGRFVAFHSTATNLVAGVANVGDVYVRDLLSGTTLWASADARAALLTAQNTTNGICYNQALSANGGFVAFEISPASGSSSLTPGVILRYNLQSATTDVVFTNAYVPQRPYEDIHNLSITPDGRFIAFIANSNSTPGSTACVLVWDAQTGIATLASGNLSNIVAAGTLCEKPTLSADGRFVAFLSSNTNMVTNAVVGDFHAYRRDLLNGTTTLLDADSAGRGSPINPDTALAMSTNGQFIVFECAGGNLAPSGPNPRSDIFVRNASGNVTELISARNPALISRTPNEASRLAEFSLSADGRYVAFSSEGDNLLSIDTNGCRDVFVRDLLLGTNVLVSAATNGFSGNGLSAEPSISADGRYVAFMSQATNLVARDTNKTSDIFVRDLLTKTTVLASKSYNSTAPGNNASRVPFLSQDGRYVLFRSKASNLANGSFGGNECLFLRDLQLGTNYTLTANAVIAAAATPDCSLVAFITSNPSPVLNVWTLAMLAGSNVLTGTGPMVAISPAGNRLVYSTSTGLFARDLVTTGDVQIGPRPANSHPGLRFSADGRWLAYTRTNQVYLYDFQSGSHRLVSHSSASLLLAGNDVSDWPDISADGRFVAFRSAATNIITEDGNGVPDVFLFDQQTGTNTLLSLSTYANRTADHRSLAPAFSADGHMLVFQSWASDLVPNDLNRSSDVFALAFLYLSITRETAPSPGIWLSWPFASGKNSRVQFKTNLAGAWQDLSGSATNLGNKSFLKDANPTATNKFYRVLQY